MTPKQTQTYFLQHARYQESRGYYFVRTPDRKFLHAADIEILRIVFDKAVGVKK